MLVKLKRLSNPRVRRRLKIGLSVWAGAILLGVSYKLVYDIGNFDAKALKNENNAINTSALAKLTLESAQHLVTNVLKEDPGNPKTFVTQIIEDNYNSKLVPIIIENNKQRKIAWIFDMRLFFIADVYNDKGLNLTKGFEQHHELDLDQ
jgi:hypothetical protein